MSSLTPLVDTLLATRLAQRVDLVPLKSEVEVAGAAAVVQTEKVTNDVRLPSRAGMLQQLGVGLLKGGDNRHASTPARAEKNVTLSNAARTISAILEASFGATQKITGTEPLWPKVQPPLAPVLSATLANTVASSGLFYESHLAQFVAGTVTLAQLAQEPQARLNAMVKVALSLPITDAPGQGSGVNSMAATMPAGIQKQTSDLPSAASVFLPADKAVVVDSDKSGGGAPLQSSLTGGLAASLDASPLAHSNDTIRLHKIIYQSIQNAEGQEPTAKHNGASATDAARSNALGLAGIHPDAIALVRQQLELLAMPVFRWNGEAWPGVPMDWEIHEKDQQDQNPRQAVADNEAVPRTWSTRVVLTLPMLKDIEVRINLVGTALQVHLTASENATREVLGQAGTQLPKRLDKLGLQLTGLEIGLPAARSANQSGQEADDVHN